MIRALVAGLLLVGCRPEPVCATAGGHIDDERDPIALLDEVVLPITAELLEVVVRDDTAFLCSGGMGLTAWNALNPTQITKDDALTPSLGNQDHPRCQHLALGEAGRIYLTNRGDSVQPDSFITVVDALNPQDLRELHARRFDTEIEGLATDGTLLYVATHSRGLLVLDASSLEVRGGVGSPLVNAWDVALHGNIAWVADGEAGLSAVRIDDPENPVVVGTLALGGVAKDVVIEGDRAWVALGSHGVAAVDLRDPTAPALLDWVDTPGSAQSVAVSTEEQALIVADWNDLRLYDISDPDALRPLGHQPLQLKAGVDNRSFGVAAGRAGLLLSSNWSRLASYRLHPERASGDLDLSATSLTLARTEPGSTTNALLNVRNAGPKPLHIDAVEVVGDELEVELEAGILKPGEDRVARIAWSPEGNGVLDAFVNLFTDDADEPEKCVVVIGNRPGLSVGDTLPATAFAGLDGEIYRTDQARGTLLLAYFATS